MLWTAFRSQGSWWYVDEWYLFENARGSWSGILEGHQGHLEIQNYLTYRLQRSWFGLESRTLVYTTFAASLAALQVGVALVLRRLGVHDLLALLAGGMIVYFGPGAQNAVFEFQQGINFALALCFFAGWVALRDDRSREGALTIAGLLVLAIACDSGLGSVGAVYAGILVLARWPRRLAAEALVLPAVVGILWLTVGDDTPHVGATSQRFVDVVERMLSAGAAGLVGGGERYLPGAPDHEPAYPFSTTETALLVVVVVVGCVVLGRRLLRREVVVSLIAGTVAAVVGAVAVAYDRAWLIEPDRLPGSRYIQWVAVFLLVAILPVLVATLTPPTERGRQLALAGACLTIVAIFLVNLNSFNEFQKENDHAGERNLALVAESVDLIQRGCGPEGGLDPDAVVIPPYTVAGVERLLEEGALTEDFARPASPLTRFLLCTAEPG